VESPNDEKASNQVVVGDHRPVEPLKGVSLPQLNSRMGEVHIPNHSPTHFGIPYRDKMHTLNDAISIGALISTPAAPPVSGFSPPSAPKGYNQRMGAPSGPAAMRPIPMGQSMHRPTASCEPAAMQMVSMGQIKHQPVTSRPKVFETRSSASEVGTYLPFKLQHDLLNTIQTLIEEACFYFAKKWLPGLLDERRWVTPEQGELTAWWAMLRNSRVPPQAIDFRGAEPAAIFQYCRQIRNNAVHRGRVSIPGVKLMVGDALELVCGLKDDLRTTKIRKLQYSLEHRDQEALRRSLDEPLGHIGLQGQTLLDRSNGQANMVVSGIDQSQELEKGQIQPGMSRDAQNAFQPGPPLGTTGEKSGNGSKIQVENLKPMAESSTSNAIHPTPDSRAFPSMRDTENQAQDQEQRVAAGKVSNITEGARDQTNMESLPKTAIAGPIVQTTSHVTASNGMVLKQEPFVIDLTKDTIIDLTQDSDENDMDEIMDDDSVVELGEAFVFSDLAPGHVDQIPRPRIVEPDRRREKKEMTRRRRVQRAAEALAAATKREKKGKKGKRNGGQNGGKK
jgi:hypothetical protein